MKLEYIILRNNEFIFQCRNLGARHYEKIARAISDYGPLTDEQICDYSGVIRIDLTRSVISDMKSHGLLQSFRVLVPEKNWHVTKYKINY